MKLSLCWAPALALALAACQAPPAPTDTAPPPSPTAIAGRASATPSSAPPTVTAAAAPTDTAPPLSPTAPAAPPATLPPDTLLPPAPPSPTPAAPVILSFTAAPELINPGEPITLTWATTAERVVIYRLDAQGRLTMPDYPGGPAGSLVVTPPAELRNHVDFVLFALSGDQTVQAGAAVALRCPDTWFFPNPPQACPSTPAGLAALVGQPFERGRMLWLAGPQRIYILYDDVRGRRWQIRPDTWTPDQPESDPALTPPAGLYQPVRGFGLAWRDEQAPIGTRAQDYLGWALEPEAALGQGAAQCEAAAKYAVCYVGAAAGRIYKLEPEGSGWSVWAGP